MSISNLPHDFDRIDPENRASGDDRQPDDLSRCAAANCEEVAVVTAKVFVGDVVALCPNCSDEQDSTRPIPGVGSSPTGVSR